MGKAKNNFLSSKLDKSLWKLHSVVRGHGRKKKYIWHLGESEKAFWRRYPAWPEASSRLFLYRSVCTGKLGEFTKEETAKEPGTHSSFRALDI